MSVIKPIRENFSASVNLNFTEIRTLDWPQLLYQYGVLVVNLNKPLDFNEIWEFNSLFGVPWKDKDYFNNRENFVPIPDDRFISYFSNKGFNKKIYTNMSDEIGWHRDCHWFKQNRFPIRSLYSTKVPTSDDINAGNTIFVYDRNIFDMLTKEEQEFYKDCEIDVQYVYDRNKPKVRRPLVKTHFFTGKPHIELNSYLTFDEDLTNPENIYGATDIKQGPFITKLYYKGQQVSTSHIANLFRRLTTDVQNYYRHRWSNNQFLIWDNTTVLHRRSDISSFGDQERAFIRMNMNHLDPAAVI